MMVTIFTCFLQFHCDWFPLFADLIAFEEATARMRGSAMHYIADRLSSHLQAAGRCLS
jgi:hypothetical protein